MLLKLALLLITIPMLELFVLIPLASQIGVGPTIAIIVVTGIVGAWLARREGLGAWRRFREELATGALPQDAMVDGVAVLVACAFLMTPGVLTDAVGMALLIPAVRSPLKGYIKRRITKLLQNSYTTVIDGRSQRPSIGRRVMDDDVIDITPANERHPA